IAGCEQGHYLTVPVRQLADGLPYASKAFLGGVAGGAGKLRDPSRFGLARFRPLDSEEFSPAVGLTENLQCLVGNGLDQVCALLRRCLKTGKLSPAPHGTDAGVLHGILGVGAVPKTTESDSAQLVVCASDQRLDIPVRVLPRHRASSPIGGHGGGIPWKLRVMSPAAESRSWLSGGRGMINKVVPSRRRSHNMTSLAAAVDICAQLDLACTCSCQTTAARLISRKKRSEES